MPPSVDFRFERSKFCCVICCHTLHTYFNILHPLQPLHFNFVFAGANLKAEMYNMPSNRDESAVADMIGKVKVPEFTPRSGVRIAVTDAEAQSLHCENLGMREV